MDPERLSQLQRLLTQHGLNPLPEGVVTVLPEGAELGKPTILRAFDANGKTMYEAEIDPNVREALWKMRYHSNS